MAKKAVEVEVEVVGTLKGDARVFTEDQVEFDQGKNKKHHAPNIKDPFVDIYAKLGPDAEECMKLRLMLAEKCRKGTLKDKECIQGTMVLKACGQSILAEAAKLTAGYKALEVVAGCVPAVGKSYTNGLHI